MAFPIPDDFYQGYLSAHDEPETGDLHGACAALGVIAARLKAGAAPDSGRAEVDAACRIWHFFNPTGESRDDIVVVDHVGDGMSMEFAPMVERACSLAGESCACRHGARMAEAAVA